MLAMFRENENGKKLHITLHNGEKRSKNCQCKKSRGSNVPKKYELYVLNTTRILIFALDSHENFYFCIFRLRSLKFFAVFAN